MKIRGERECTDCGTRWSYYETGSVGCPACGSLRSVGRGERSSHTDHAVSFDLTDVRSDVDEDSIDELAERARDASREYLRSRGFVSGGALQELDDTYLAASELRHVADLVDRSRRLTEDEELYFLALLRDADAGRRPPAQELPSTFRSARGLAAADAVQEYRTDLRTWTDGRELTGAERSLLERLDDHVTRIRMLEGDVEPAVASTLLVATRDLAKGLRDGDEDALALASDHLDSLE